MQQQPQQQQPGATQFGAPPSEMAPFPSSAGGPRTHMLGIPGGADPLQPPPPSSQLAEAASPINSRPPPSHTEATANFDELAPAVAGGFPDDEVLVAGEEAERCGAPGNRWPRQETLALLKIRSEMDAAFREATFKGPLWEEVSRKLAELGFKRSAKKCKEKFENVHKYYKRTKEGRAGRQDGKTYRFFSQLEALHNGGRGSATTAALPFSAASPTSISFTTAMAVPSAARIQPLPVSAVAPPPISTPTRAVPQLGPQGVCISPATVAAGICFSWNSSSSSSSESDDEDTEDAGGSREGRKRKRSGGSRARRQMMTFFEGLIKQVMERQEALQQRFLEAIEKREQDRMIREEAWRRQEMTRLSREQELLAQERGMAASRDTAVISYLQKISGQSVPLPAMPTATSISISTLPPPPSHAPPHPQQPAHPQQMQTPPKQKPRVVAPPFQEKREAQHHTPSANIGRQQPSSAAQLVPIGPENQEGPGSGSLESPSSSRWPKAEVHALIKLRSGLELRYQEAGPKGPLWEEISAGMQRLGYNRSAKRCKEKWENINKYFKKVKDSTKQRPEDSKTCPYFHQLDALYRKKQLGSSGSSMGVQQQQVQDTNSSPVSQERTESMTPPQHQPPAEAEVKKGGNGGNGDNRNGGNTEARGGSTGGAQVQTSNEGHPPSLFEEEMESEDVTKDLMEQRQQQAMMDDDYDKMDEPDSDNLDQDDEDDDDEDDEDSKMQYKIQFQRQNVSGSGGNASTAAAATAGSFMAMVK